MTEREDGSRKRRTVWLSEDKVEETLAVPLLAAVIPAEEEEVLLPPLKLNCTPVVKVPFWPLLFRKSNAVTCRGAFLCFQAC